MTGTSLNPQIRGSHYPNGNWKSQNFCNNGAKSGYQITWHENGNIKSSGDFENNKPIGLHTLWFDNNTKRAEINYRDGRRDGSFTFWHNNGRIKFQGNYLSGQVIGTWTIWHSNSQKYKETNTIEGERLYWHDNGQMRSRQWRISDTNKYMPNRNWDNKGNCINSWAIALTGCKYHTKKNIKKLTYSFTEAFTYFSKNGLRKYEINRDCDLHYPHCQEKSDNCKVKEYFVTWYKFYTGGTPYIRIKFSQEDCPDKGKPYSWRFYINKNDSSNAEDELIYEYLIDQNTYKDLNLYDELLKIDNKKLNEILIQIQEYKSIFFNLNLVFDRNKNYKDSDAFTLLSGINKVILVGNVVESHVIRDSSFNVVTTSLLIATSEWWTDKNTGHKQEKTEWHRITIFGELAEYAFHCYRGTKVYIEGRLQTNTSLENTETNRYASEIVVSSPNGVIKRIDPPYIDYVDPDTAYINNMANFDLEPF